MRYLPLLCIALLAGCSPMHQVHVDAPQENAHIVADKFYAADNAALPFRSWLPKGRVTRVIVALHGFNDYSKGMEVSGYYFANHGAAFYAYDQRGFGQGPYTGIWSNEENLVSDLKQFVLLMRLRYPGVPVYVLGESMGGAVAITALADPGFPKVDGLMLVSPAVWGDETMSAFYRTTLWVAAHTLPGWELTGSDLKIQATNNIPVLRRMSADPLVQKKARVDTVYGLVQLMDDAYVDVPQVKTPTLFLYGEQDQVVPRPPVESSVRRFGVPVTYVFYPEGYHMLTRDIQRKQVLDDMQSWLERPATAVPSGYGTRIEPVAK